MLYELLVPLAEFWGPFNVFRYLTFRAALGAGTALLLTLMLGPWVIERLRQLQVGQRIRAEGPASHQGKAGTPTMGGLLIVGAVLVSTLAWADLHNILVWICVLGTSGFALLGFIDDYLGCVHPRRRGMSAGSKLRGQLALAASIGLALWWLADQSLFTTQLAVPFLKDISPMLGWTYIPFAMLVLIAASNAVNLTDGLDGLATGCVAVAAITYTAFAYLAGHAIIAEYLGIIYVRGSAEVTIFAASIVGACLGFLWFNCFPAQVFMGDTGSLALGGAVGITALLIKQEILLLLVGGVFCIEAVSVILQVGSFRLRGKRVFRMAPIHHHFELGGWAEPKVIVRFWLLAMFFALMSFATLKLR